MVQAEPLTYRGGGRGRGGQYRRFYCTSCHNYGCPKGCVVHSSIMRLLFLSILLLICLGFFLYTQWAHMLFIIFATVCFGLTVPFECSLFRQKVVSTTFKGEPVGKATIIQPGKSRGKHISAGEAIYRIICVMNEALKPVSLCLTLLFRRSPHCVITTRFWWWKRDIPSGRRAIACQGLTRPMFHGESFRYGIEQFNAKFNWYVRETAEDVWLQDGEEVRVLLSQLRVKVL